MRVALFVLLTALVVALACGLAACGRDAAGPHGPTAATIESTRPCARRPALISAYWASSPTYGDHAAEVVGAVDAAHVAPENAGQLAAVGIGAIVDAMWFVFDPKNHAVRADADAQIGKLASLLSPYESNVVALYVFDEPYIDANAVPRSVLEEGIARVKKVFPTIPTYITFAHHCFDPAESDPACSVLSPAQRGVPANLDWVSFDWYATTADADSHVATRIRSGIDRLAASTKAKILLTPEAFVDGTRDETTTMRLMQQYFELARTDPRVSGVDWFLWADAGAMRGLTSSPSMQALARRLWSETRTSCDG